MNINIDPVLVDTLATLADANANTPEGYATTILNAHLGAALKRSVAQDLDSRPIAEVAVLAASVKDSARSIDEAKPVSIEPVPVVVENTIPSDEAIKNGLPL